MKIQNLTEGRCTAFAVPFTKHQRPTTINVVKSYYHDGEPSKGYLPILIDGHLAIVQKDGNGFIATVFRKNEEDGSVQCLIFYIMDLLQLAKEIPQAPWGDGQSQTIIDVKKDEFGKEVYYFHAFGYYHRKWHMYYAADYYQLWAVHPNIDYMLIDDPDGHIIRVNEYDSISNLYPGYYFLEKGTHKISFTPEAYYNEKQEVIVYGDRLYKRSGKARLFTFVTIVENILEVYKIVRNLKRKPYKFVPTFFTKKEIMELAFKYHSYICQGVLNRLENLPNYCSTKFLLQEFGVYAQDILDKEYQGKLTNLRKPYRRGRGR